MTDTIDRGRREFFSAEGAGRDGRRVMEANGTGEVHESNINIAISRAFRVLSFPIFFSFRSR